MANTEPAPTLSLPPRAGRTSTGARGYLLVLEGDRSSIFDLPGEGVILIGRDDGVDLPLEDPSVSRRHARLMLGGDELRVADLDSHNGTFINGERVEGARVLVSGDVINICSATLVVHRGQAPRPARAPLDHPALGRRLHEEIARSLAYARPFALACLRTDAAGAGLRSLPAIALDRLRLLDVVGAGPAGEVVLLLPELDEDAARAALFGVLQALGSDGSVRAGLAIMGKDACDAETLLATAISAAEGAAPGQVATSDSLGQRLVVGDRTIVVGDPAMARTYQLLRRLAGSELPVLVLGETGVGKENAAFAVHTWSARSAGPFLPVNCSAIPENLVESELFGHERGAFSGAVQTKIGLLEAASGGTVFLDEVGDLSPATQAKLLRALESGRLTRVGDTRERTVNLRLVAATNRNLDEDVKSGRFRADLFFRLAAATVILPPLRERRRELPLLARELLQRACRRAGRPALELSAETLERLTAHAWPGNVRELRNAMDYGVATATGEVIEPWHLPASLTAPPPDRDQPGSAAAAPTGFRPLADEIEELERRRIGEALAAADGVHVRAAELIGMPLRTFQQRLKDYGIARRR